MSPLRLAAVEITGALDAARGTFELLLLDTGNAELIEFIRERIHASGPVTFAWFMEQALYHPEHGYYSSGHAAIGRGGDYFTNVSVGPIFGQLMAEQLREMWTGLGKPAEFVIVEQGAHDGQLAHDVLHALERRDGEFFAAVRYRIVEPFARLRARQEKMLAGFLPRIQWSESVAVLKPFCGVHFSNELFDAMPVHLIRWSGREWLERCVTNTHDGFVFTDQPITNLGLLLHLANLPRQGASGYETEVNLAALTQIDAVAEKLAKGFIVVVDYGFARDDYYSPHRPTGTLQCRAKHQVLRSPLMNVGAADITAHIEWTSVVERAELAGLKLLGFTDQHHFLTGLLSGPAGNLMSESTDAKNARALQTLLHPGFLGMKFQFLVLGKGVDPATQLSGLQFARDPRLALRTAMSRS